MKRKTDEEKVFDEILASLVKARRKELNLSQEYVSTHSGVTRITIGKWERGIKTPITFDFYNVLRLLYKNPSDFWNDFTALYEKKASPIREAAEKSKYFRYIEQTQKAKRKGKPER